MNRNEDVENSSKAKTITQAKKKTNRRLSTKTELLLKSIMLVL